jgi:hypothetical protein
MIKMLYIYSNKFFFALLLVVYFFSFTMCKKQQQKQEIEYVVDKWLKRKINFPENYQCNILGKDTTHLQCADLLDSEFKILLYIDSTGCTDCKLQLMEWNDLINEFNYLNNNKISFLLFIHPKDISEIQMILQRNNFLYPVFIDVKNEINSMNKFEKNPDYRCFLLDRDNRVIIIGNPVKYTSIIELYKKQLE